MESPLPSENQTFPVENFHNAVPVGDNLYKKRTVNSPVCPVCNLEKETIEHTLLACPWTTPVWYGSQLHLSSSPANVDKVDSWVIKT